jgi:hypothetical protein
MMAKKRLFILGHFYIILNLEVQRKPTALLNSNGLGAGGKGSGQTLVYIYANTL